MIYASFKNSGSTKWFHLSAGSLCKNDKKYILGSQNRWKISKGRKSGVVITLLQGSRGFRLLEKTSSNVCAGALADPSPAVSAPITASDGKNAQ